MAAAILACSGHMRFNLNITLRIKPMGRIAAARRSHSTCALCRVYNDRERRRLHALDKETRTWRYVRHAILKRRPRESAMRFTKETFAHWSRRTTRANMSALTLKPAHG